MVAVPRKVPTQLNYITVLQFGRWSLQHVREPLCKFSKLCLIEALLFSLRPTVIAIEVVFVFVRIGGGQELNRNGCGMTGRGKRRC